MPAHFPGAQNTFVPSHEASGKLVVDFSRKVGDFAINEYTQLVPVTQVAGYYLEMTVEEAGRILNSDLADFDWPDGMDAPEDSDGTESFEFKEFRTKRKKYGFRLGDLGIGQATWDIVAQHGTIKAQQAMTARTQAAITLLTTSGNYAADHTSDVASISGNSGKWDASTTARQDIKRALNHAAQVIERDTLAAVSPNDLVLVLNPNAAKAISEGQELADYLKQSPEAYAYVKGDLANQNRNRGYGIPPMLYDYPVVVERTYKTTSRRGASSVTKTPVLADGNAMLVSRPGGLEGTYGAPSFSTCTIFIQEEMTVETLHDVDNRLTRGRVVENFEAKLTAPVSGFLFTNVI